MKKKLYFFGILASLFFLPIFLIGTVALLGGSNAVLSEDDCYNGGTVPINDQGTEKNAQAIYEHWQKKYHATLEGSSGILGVLQLESQLNPKAVNSSSGATGIAQWLGGRKTALDALAKKENKPDTDLGVQLDYLDQEITNSYQSSKEIFTMKDTHQAAYDWLMKFEGMSQNPEQWFLPQRYAYADHWQQSLKGGTSGGGDSSDSVDCSSSADDGEILTIAKSWLGWFHYPHPDTHSVAQIGGNALKPDKEGTTDCSGYVWLVLNKAKCKVPADMGWFTGSMTSDARGPHHYLKEVSENESQAGDVVIVNQGSGVGEGGHTAILEEKWHGNDTKIIQEGGVGDRVNEGTFGTSFQSLLSGGDVCLARAQK